MCLAADCGRLSAHPMARPAQSSTIEPAALLGFRRYIQLRLLLRTSFDSQSASKIDPVDLMHVTCCGYQQFPLCEYQQLPLPGSVLPTTSRKSVAYQMPY